jgi:hypothetical protein
MNIHVILSVPVPSD